MSASHAIAQVRALIAEGRFDAAVALAGGSSNDPRVDAELRSLAALANLRRSDMAGAIASAEEAVRLAPDNAAYQVNLARLYAMNSRWNEAVARCEDGIRLSPGFGEAHALLCEALLASGRAADAIERADAALASIPTDAGMLFVRAQALRDIGHAAEAVAAFERLATVSPSDERAISALANAMLYDPSRSPQHVTAMHARYARTVQRFHPCTPLPDAARGHVAPLRVGLVSGDLRAHSVSFFLESILGRFDRTKITLHAYPTNSRRDAVTERLATLFDSWRCLEGMSADSAAKAIRADAIDVLIDLAGHTGGARLDVFRRRPTPVQASYLGYPATTGLNAIRWRIVDSLTDPPGLSDALCVERLVRLDPCFLCYAPPQDMPEPCVRARGGPAVFGSFNALAKLSDDCVELWSRVLLACPGSPLRLKAIPLRDEAIRADVWARFGRHGITPDRIEPIGWCDSLQDHFALYQSVDIALDPTPYCGTTTTCEALWMGVPVVTLAGPSHVSRVGASLLSCAGLGNLVAHNADEFVRIASELAGDLDRQATLRATLRKTMLASPLCDASVFCRRFEAMILDLWSRRVESVS